MDRYVYPAAPACCLLAARAWLSVSVVRPDLAKARDNLGARWSIGLLGIVLVGVGIFGGLSLFNLGLQLPAVAVLIPVSLAAAGVVLAGTIVRRRAVSPLVFATVLMTLLAVYVSVITVGLPVLDLARPTAAVAEDLRSQLTEGDQVGLYRLERWRYSLRYYLERPVARLQQPEDVEAFFRKSPGYVLMLDEDYARLLDHGMNLRCVSERPAVVGTTGRGLRKQKWGALVVATLDDTPRLTDTAR